MGIHAKEKENLCLFDIKRMRLLNFMMMSSEHSHDDDDDDDASTGISPQALCVP